MKNYENTQKQIKQLAKGNAKVKKMFPEVFETKLEVGKWYKSIDKPLRIFYVTELKDNRYYYYGFNTLGYFKKEDWFSFIDCGLQKGFTLATDSEVLEALIDEAKKRGFRENVHIKGLGNTQNGKFHYRADINYLYCGSYACFQNGKWAEIVKTYTKEEAEKLLNAKII